MMRRLWRRAGWLAGWLMKFVCTFAPPTSLIHVWRAAAAAAAAHLRIQMSRQTTSEKGEDDEGARLARASVAAAAHARTQRCVAARVLIEATTHLGAT